MSPPCLALDNPCDVDGPVPEARATMPPGGGPFQRLYNRSGAMSIRLPRHVQGALQRAQLARDRPAGEEAAPRDPETGHKMGLRLQTEGRFSLTLLASRCTMVAGPGRRRVGLLALLACPVFWSGGVPVCRSGSGLATVASKTHAGPPQLLGHGPD